jgi:copper chaperone NosL
MSPRAALLAVLLAASCCVACAAGPARPVAIDTAHDQCSSCRMVISDPRLAGQIVAPGEEPRLFDDLGCLRAGLRVAGSLPPGAEVFVADHRTGDWVPAARAVFARAPSIDTPMGSHIVAYADEAGMREDPYANGAEPIPPGEILGAAGAAEAPR